MQTNFQLASVHGMLYTGGNVAFSPDGRSLFSPVQNYLSKIQLQGEGNLSFPCSNSNVQCFDLSPDGDLAIVIGQRGLGVFYSLSSRVALDTISFPPNCSIQTVKFSPCGKFVAVALENTLQVYNSPAQRVVSFHSCHRLENLHAVLTLPIQGMDWTPDSQHLLLSGQDARMKIVARDTRNKKGLAQMQNQLVGHRAAVVGAWFLDEGTTQVISIAADNVAIVWERTTTTRKELLEAIAISRMNAQIARGKKQKKSQHAEDRDDEESSEDEEEEEEEEEEDNDDEDENDALAPSFLEKQKIATLKETGVKVSTVSDVHLPDVLKFAFEIKHKFMLQHKGNVSVAAVHKPRNLVAIGYTTGIFAVHAAATEDFALIHLLSISAQTLTAAVFSPGGDWIAFGSAHLKQLMVWDWKAESYLLKEQSHYYDIACTAMTADGSSIISGGEDGKVKVWKASTGQCYVTFTEHQAGITGIVTSSATNAFFTASKDGTIRGYDLVRYRHFRVFQNPERATQYSCLAIDPSAEVLAAGSSRDNAITLFSVQTGKVIDVLTGHEGPVATLAFHPSGTVLTSGGFDTTLMFWDIFNSGDGGDRLKGEGESVAMQSEVLCVSYSHSGKRLAVLTMNSEIAVYDTLTPLEPQLIVLFRTSMDASGGWDNKNVGPNSANSNARFTTIAFAPEGDKIIAGGESKWICLYHATQGYVLKKWAVTTNLDVEGAEEQFQWRSATEAGNVNEIDVDDDDLHLRKRKLLEMPGSRHRHFATGKRKTALTCRTMHVSFSGQGTEFVCATTDGLLLFALDATKPKFQPLQLSEEVTTTRVQQWVDEKRFGLALIGALMLKDLDLGREVMRQTPVSHIPVIVSSVPSAAFPTLVLWVAREVEESRGLEHALLWAQSALMHSNEPLMGHARDTTHTTPALKTLHRALNAHKTLQTLSQRNFFTMAYLLKSAKNPPRARVTKKDGEQEEE